MPNRADRRWLWKLTVVTAITVAAILVAIPAKPRLYQGKSIKEWVVQLDGHVDRQKEREEAAEALIRIGSEALPGLQRILAWRKKPLIEKVKGFGMRLGLVRPPAIHPLELQNRACEAAYRLAEDARVDIRTLIPHLQYHATNGTYADSNSGHALAVSGAEGISILTNLLFSGTRSVRDIAGSSLRHVRTNSVAIGALMRSAATEIDASLRANALLYLQRSRGPADQLVPLALKSLQRDNGYERWAAATLLSDHTAFPGVVEALRSAAQDQDRRVRSAAESALRRAAPATASGSANQVK